MFESTSSKKQNTGGRPKKPIWRFFEQGDKIDKGHYIATCLAYKQSFRSEKATTMEKHIISNCLQVEKSIREAVIYMVKACESSRESSFSSNKHKAENHN